MYKTTFATELGCFQYTSMPFGLKNAPVIFSRIGVDAFKYFIHKFIEVYFDDSMIYGIVKNNIENLRMMLDWCGQLLIYIHLKNCIFCAPFAILPDHLVF